MGYNFLDVAKDALTGNLHMADAEKQEKRLSICRECEYLEKSHLDKAAGTCKQCGCLMTMKVKFNNSACPLGKW
jgi:uncharacterized paraquat-inducible protein A